MSPEEIIGSENTVLFDILDWWEFPSNKTAGRSDESTVFHPLHYENNLHLITYIDA